MLKPFKEYSIALKSFINLDKINWYCLCGNPNAILLLEKHWLTIQDKIDWSNLCQNPNAIPLLKKYWLTIQDKINWCYLCQNPNIFDEDEYKIACKELFKREITEEIMKTVWHPQRYEIWKHYDL